MSRMTEIILMMNNLLDRTDTLEPWERRSLSEAVLGLEKEIKTRKTMLNQKALDIAVKTLYAPNGLVNYGFPGKSALVYARTVIEAYLEALGNQSSEAEEALNLCGLAASGTSLAWPKAESDMFSSETTLGWRVNRVGEIVHAYNQETFDGRETRAFKGYYKNDGK